MTDEIESWLHTEVAPAFDRLKADPSRALQTARDKVAVALNPSKTL
jgi:hypothetical protein